MRKTIIALLAAALVLCALPAVSEAACGGLFGWRPFQNVAARRAEGRGVGQRNGPLKRRVRGEVAQSEAPAVELAKRRCRGGKCPAGLLRTI
jgi:hypothetical protein